MYQYIREPNEEKLVRIRQCGSEGGVPTTAPLNSCHGTVPLTWGTDVPGALAGGGIHPALPVRSPDPTVQGLNTVWAHALNQHASHTTENTHKMQESHLYFQTHLL